MPTLRVALSACCVLIVTLLLAAPVQAEGSLTGRWEIQAIGGNREVSFRHSGQQFVAYRVLWSEFEGKPYRLEHLYRGNLRGRKIQGKLWVREQELPDFEALRDFDGSIKGPGSVVLDRMPLKRTSATAAEIPTVAAGLSGVNEFSSGAAGRAPSARDGKAARKLVRQGDARLRRKKYAAALQRYRAAEKKLAQGRTPASLLARVGRCHLGLGQRQQALPLLARALRLDPQDAGLRKDLARAAAR